MYEFLEMWSLLYAFNAYTCNLLNCLYHVYLTVILCQIPWCDCCLSVNDVGGCVCVCVCMRVCMHACVCVNYSLMLHNVLTRDTFFHVWHVLVWTLRNLILALTSWDIQVCNRLTNVSIVTDDEKMHRYLSLVGLEQLLDRLGGLDIDLDWNW